MRRRAVSGCQSQSIEKLKTIINEIDPEIRDIVLELNAKGRKTLMSCAGHPGLQGSRGIRGYIWFENHLGKMELTGELRTLGLKAIKVEWDDEYGETTIASFAPIGLPKQLSDFGSLIFSLTLPG